MLRCQVNATHSRHQGKERQMQDMNCRDFTTEEISGSTAFDLCTFAMRHFIWESALSSVGLTSCSTAWPVTQSITEMGTQKPIHRKHIRLRSALCNTSCCSQLNFSLISTNKTVTTKKSSCFHPGWTILIFSFDFGKYCYGKLHPYFYLFLDSSAGQSLGHIFLCQKTLATVKAIASH